MNSYISIDRLAAAAVSEFGQLIPCDSNKNLFVFYHSINYRLYHLQNVGAFVPSYFV